MAQAIADVAKAPAFDLASADPSIAANYDMIIIGTPVEGASPAKETQAFMARLPKVENKKVILFCTFRLFGNARTMNKMEKELSEKGYETVLKVSKKGMKPGKPVDFSDVLGEVKKVL